MMMSSQKLSLRMMDTRLKRSTKRIFITLYTPLLYFFSNKILILILCVVWRENTSESSILFLYLLSGLHLRQLLTLTNHSHHECYFSLLLDSDTSILSRLIFFVSSEKLAKTTINTMWNFMKTNKCKLYELLSLRKSTFETLYVTNE